MVAIAPIAVDRPLMQRFCCPALGKRKEDWGECSQSCESGDHALMPEKLRKCSQQCRTAAGCTQVLPLCPSGQ